MKAMIAGYIAKHRENAEKELRHFKIQRSLRHQGSSPPGKWKMRAASTSTGLANLSAHILVPAMQPGVADTAFNLTTALTRRESGWFRVAVTRRRTHART